MRLSVFSSRLEASAATVCDGTWPSFVAGLSSPQDASIPKAELPLWSPAIFAGGERRAEAVEAVHALVLDVDADPVPTREELEAGLASFQAFAHSSSSATASAPRWRAVIALSRPVSGDEHRRLWAAVTAALPFPVGVEAKDASRAWFVPRAGADGYFESFETHGAPLDVDALLARAPEGAGREVAGPTASAEGAAVQSFPGDVVDPEERAYRRELFARDCATMPPSIEGQGGDAALFRVVQRGAYDHALPIDDVLEIVREHFDPRCSPPWGAALAERVTHKARSAKTSSTRPRNEPPPAALRDVFGAPKIPTAPRSAPANDVESETHQMQPAPNASSPLGFTFGGWDVEPPDVEFLVEGLIPAGSVGTFFARADSMKTWQLLDMAIAVAHGRPWLERATRKSKVGIVDIETGRNNLRRRLYMLRAGNTPNLGAVSFPSLSPAMPEFWSALAKEGFNLVIVDSLRKANPGADENSSAEAIKPLVLAAQFSELTGCAVIFIHHANKASSDGWPEFRGSGAIEDQVDYSFAVRKVDVTPTRKRVEVKCCKPGDMRTPEPFAVEIAFDDEANRATVSLAETACERGPVAGVEENRKANWEKIRLTIMTHGPQPNVRALERAAGVKSGTLGDDIRAMRDAGEVVQLPQRGLCLDSPESRVERVKVAIVAYPAVRKLGQLAKLAHVDGDDVRRALASRAVFASQDGRFLVP